MRYPRILIIDLDKDLATAFADLFKSNGYATSIALSGEEAFEVLKDHSDIGLALIDLRVQFSLEQLEKLAIEQALRLVKGNKSRAAGILGISRDSLYRKIKRYGISN